MKVRKSKYTETSTKPIQTKWLQCSSCEEEVQVEVETTAVTCWRCAVKKTEPPLIRQAPAKKEGPRKPKGWHLMKVYVDPDGNVFHEGEEKPELKDTLKPTPIRARKSKAQRDAELEKHEAKLVKFHEKKKKLKDNAEGLKSLVEDTLQEEQEA